MKLKVFGDIAIWHVYHTTQFLNILKNIEMLLFAAHFEQRIPHIFYLKFKIVLCILITLHMTNSERPSDLIETIHVLGKLKHT